MTCSWRQCVPGLWTVVWWSACRFALKQKQSFVLQNLRMLSDSDSILSFCKTTLCYWIMCRTHYPINHFQRTATLIKLHMFVLIALLIVIHKFVFNFLRIVHLHVAVFVSWLSIKHLSELFFVFNWLDLFKLNVSQPKLASFVQKSRTGLVIHFSNEVFGFQSDGLWTFIDLYIFYQNRNHVLFFPKLMCKNRKVKGACVYLKM